MKEKITFDRESRILKSNIDFDKYESLFSCIYKPPLDYAEANPKDLEGIRSLLLMALYDHNVPCNFKMNLTKRNTELNIPKFVNQCSRITQKNTNIQKNGQNLIKKLNKHIEDCIERHVSFHSEKFDTACHLLNILEGLLPVMAERVKRFQGIIDDIRDAIFSDSARVFLAMSSDQYDADIYVSAMDIADYYYSNNDFTEALRLFTYLLEIGYQSYILKIGDCQLHLNRVDEALQSYKLGIESGFTKGYLRIADCYLHLNQPDEAIQSYQQGIESGLTEGYLHIGDCLSELNRFDEAMQYYQQAIEAGKTGGYARISDYYAKMGNQEEAAVWYKKWIEAGSNDSKTETQGNENG